jgi:hypothetical protein
MTVQPTNNRRQKSILRFCVGALIVVVIAYPIFTFKGIPSALFYKRQERKFCIRCGRQDLEEKRMSLEGGVHKSSKMLFQPRIDGIDSEHCDHWFLPTASKDGFFEIRKFRWVKGGEGNMDGDPLYQEPALIRAFASLAANDVGKALDIFMMLKWETNLCAELRFMIQKQKASSERIKESLLDGQNRRQRLGSVITN